MNELKTLKEDNDWRTPNQLEIIKAFIYKNYIKDKVLSIDIYDKKLKQMFIGNIHSSNWTRKEKLSEDNPTSNYIKKKLK